MESNGSNYGYGSGYESRSSTPTPSVSSYESHGESHDNSSNESRKGRILTYTEWKHTCPPIVRGGLSSGEEIRRAYEEWVAEKRGGTVNRGSESRFDTSPTETREEKAKQYFAEIDKLIEDLENGMKGLNPTSAEVQAVMNERQQKIDTLRALAESAKAAEAERVLVEKMKDENRMLDSEIIRLTKGLNIK